MKDDTKSVLLVGFLAGWFFAMAIASYLVQKNRLNFTPERAVECKMGKYNEKTGKLELYKQFGGTLEESK